MDSFIYGIIIIFIITVLFYCLGKVSDIFRLLSFLSLFAASVFLAFQMDNIIISILIILSLGVFPLILSTISIIEMIKTLKDKKNNSRKN